MIVDKSYEVMTLPMLDQVGIYNGINQSLTILGYENRTAHPIVVSVFACPDDSGSGSARQARGTHLVSLGLADEGERLGMHFTSYSGCFGSLRVDAFPIPARNCSVSPRTATQANGAFNDLAPVRFGSFTDGLSSTLIVAEKHLAGLRSLDALNILTWEKRGWWITGNMGDTLFTTMFPPNMSSKVATLAGDSHFFAASSPRPGGLNALMGDGSGRFIKDSIDTWPYDQLTGVPRGARLSSDGWWENLPRAGVWQMLGTRAGGEIVPSGEY
jgi:hypothetical protein